MARVITNEEIYGVLGSIDSSMQKSLTLMKDSLSIDQRRAALAKESAERARTAEKLDSLDDQAAYDAGETTSSRPSAMRSGLSMATAGGIFGNGNLLKIGLAAAAAPFALSFMKGFLFGENGIFKQATDYLSTTGLTGITDKLGAFLSNELTGTILGTLVFGKKFILFTLAQNAVTKYIEDKFGVDIPDWLQGPAGAAMSIIAASIIGAGAKRALFAVGGAALAGTLKLGKKGGYKAIIAAASLIGAKELAAKMAAKEAAEAAEVAAFKNAAKYSAANVPVGKLPAPDVPTNWNTKPKYTYDPKLDKYFSASKPDLELKGAARTAAEKSRLGIMAAKEAAPNIGAPAKSLAKTAGKEVIEASAKRSVKKSMLAAIPFLGSLFSLGFAAERAIAGDNTTAALQLSSAGLNLVPIAGTGLSIAADLASIPTTVFDETYPNKAIEPNYGGYDPANPSHVAHMKMVALSVQAELAKIRKNDIPAEAYQPAGAAGAGFYGMTQQDILNQYSPGGSGSAFADKGYSYNLNPPANKAQSVNTIANSTSAIPVIVQGGNVTKGGDTVNNNSSTTIVNNTYDPATSLNTTPK